MSNTRKDLLTEKDDRWKMKGVPHKEKELEPFPCPVCLGFGDIDGETCDYCSGSGEVYE